MTQDHPDFNKIVTDNYDFCRRLLIAKYGPDAEEYAGSAIMLAMKGYDPAKGDFKPYAKQAILLAACAEFAHDNGRAHSAKRAGIMTSRSMDHNNYDQEDSSETVGMSDEFVTILKKIDKLARMPKLAAIAKFLGLLDTDDTAFIMGRRSLKLDSAAVLAAISQ